MTARAPSGACDTSAVNSNVLGDFTRKGVGFRLLLAAMERLLPRIPNSWYTGPSMWPKDLTFKTFKKFFTIMVTTMVYDLGKGQI
jgi:hypothetical protein